MPAVALVTGASQGIGRAIAIRLSRDGYDVALNDLPSQKVALEEVKAQIIGNNMQSSIFLADVSSEEEVKRMIDGVVESMGGLDVMVANAGVCISEISGGFMEYSVENFQRTMSVNALGTFLCYKYAAKQMIKQGKGGRIIGAGSVTSKQGHPKLTAYSASKFAIRAMTQSAALELGKHGITVNAYAPGAVDTPLLKGMRDIHGPENPSPIGRDSQPEDIAGLVSYLVSPDAGMITGQSISINGGTFFD